MSEERYLEQEINKDLKILELKRQLAEARDEFSRLVDNMGYFTQRKLANRISKVHKQLKEKGDDSK